MLISIFGFPVSVMAQQDFIIDKTEIDSMLLLLERPNLKPRIRIRTHLQLVSKYKYFHPTVDSLISTALSIAEKHSFNFYTARSLRFRAKYNLLINAPSDVILRDISRIDSIAWITKNKLLPGWVSNLSAQYYMRVGELDSVKIYIDSLNRQLDDNMYTDRGFYHTFKGMYHQKRNEYSQALNEYNHALEEKMGGKTYLYNHLSTLYLELNDVEKAKTYNILALELLEQVPSYNYIQSKIISGEIALAEKDTLLAIQLFEEAEEIRKEHPTSRNYTAAHFIYNLYKDSQPEKAKEILDKILDYQYTEPYPFLLVEKGKSLLSISNENKANSYCNEALEIASRRLQYNYISQACDCLIEIAERTKNLNSKITFLETKLEAQEKENSKSRLKDLARNLAAYELDREKDYLQRELNQNKEITQQKLQKYQIGIGLLSLLLFMGLIGYRMLHRRNKTIEAQESIIKTTEEEKIRLLQELHHRVKNNLQMVSSLMTLQRRSEDSDSARAAIQASKERIRSMAILHQDIYNEEGRIGVPEYIKKLTYELLSNYEPESNKIELALNIQPVELTIDTLVPLGLIVNELMTNAIKYAFENRFDGKIAIDLYENEKKLYLIVSDDGIGFDLPEGRMHTFGYTLIRVLSRQLGGELQVVNQNGTIVTMVFDDYK